MKLSKKNNGLVKIAGATMVAIFSLASVFVGTYAWFSTNQAVSNTGMSVSVGVGSSLNILSCYAVRYDGNYGAIAYDISGGNEDITMSEYDYIFTDRNVNTPLFLRMEIADFNSENDLTVTIPCNGAYKDGSKIEPNLSNVVCAKFMRGIKVNGNVVPDTNTWTGTEQTTQQVVNSYKGMLANAASEVGTPFVVGNTKNNSITLTINANDIFNQTYISTKVVDNVSVDYVVVFVALDYYVNGNINLVTAYLDSYGSANHDLSFSSDIQRITLNNEGN